MLAFVLIILGILLRFSPHVPNFTPVAAIALFGGTYLNKKQSLIVPLLLMIISDFVIGFHNVIPFTWGAFIFITILGYWIKKHKSVSRVICASMASAFLFYIISNFGVWAMGWYPLNFNGLLQCYIMALPFLRNFTISTLVYTTIFFGIYELAARLVRETKFSKVLLTN